MAMSPTPPEKLEDLAEDAIIPPDPLGREPGEPLAPSRFSKEYLEGVRDTSTRLVWLAEYQQMPTDPEGDFFKIGRIQIEDTPPSDVCTLQDGLPVDIQGGVRFWDLAATEASMSNRDPDYISGTLMSESKSDRRFWWIDQQRARLAPEQIDDLIIMTAKLDGKKVKIRIEQEPGASGKKLIAYYVNLLAGYDVEVSRRPARKP